MQHRRAPRVTVRPAASCDLSAFKRNPDGSWTSTRQTRVINPAGYELMLTANMVFRKGKGLETMGFDFVEFLEQQCNQPPQNSQAP